MRFEVKFKTRRTFYISYVSLLIRPCFHKSSNTPSTIDFWRVKQGKTKLLHTKYASYRCQNQQNIQQIVENLHDKN